MKITMTTTRRAAPDGVDIVVLAEGETYDLPEAFARAQIARGRAVEAKATGPAPENRAAPPAPEDKAPAPRRRRTRKEP